MALRSLLRRLATLLDPLPAPAALLAPRSLERCHARAALVDPTKRDRDAVLADPGDAMLADVGSRAVEHEHGAHRQRQGEGRLELALGEDLDVGPEEDALLRDERERDEGAREVVVVDVRRDAISLLVEVDDARVGPVCRRHDAARLEAGYYVEQQRRQRAPGLRSGLGVEVGVGLGVGVKLG